MAKIYEITVLNNKGEEVKLEQYKGKALLIVNTATGCGFTPQYDGLEKIYERFNESGFEILDFPCNQFGKQAPGSDEEIHEFCTLRFNTKFPRFKKIDVNGENESPLYTYLKSEKKGNIKWNFEKFLFDKEGNFVKRYNSFAKPEKIAKDIEKLL
ncbi:MAG: glutathione peroxidase [Bacilli bacterium]|nr:glutathione peroxidase [Bacilli bacterium]